MNTRSTRTNRHRVTAAVLAATCLSATAVGCASATAPKPTASSPAHAATGFPGTTVGRQARWLFSVASHPPVPTPAINAHFDATFLAQAPAAKLNSVFASVRSLKLDSVTKSTASNKKAALSIRLRSPPALASTRQGDDIHEPSRISTGTIRTNSHTRGVAA